jgi:hypothetical protein
MQRLPKYEKLMNDVKHVHPDLIGNMERKYKELFESANKTTAAVEKTRQAVQEKIEQVEPTLDDIDLSLPNINESRPDIDEVADAALAKLHNSVPSLYNTARGRSSEIEGLDLDNMGIELTGDAEAYATPSKEKPADDEPLAKSNLKKMGLAAIAKNKKGTDTALKNAVPKIPDEEISGLGDVTNFLENIEL